ncbi:MAG: hypothetical protein HY657_15725 [Acidobacteria bacterium]|nr:hypothetical protein [Acidobacteriota bacterium]
MVVDEAGGAADTAPCENPIRPASYMVDVTGETRPTTVSVWQVPVGDFCAKGGRFGPHQSAETVNGRINRFGNRLAWLAYFNAGVRVVDLSDPYRLRELGHYIPRTNANSHPITEGQPVAIQMNDVDIDHRGLAFASDRVGTGLFILSSTRARYRARRRPGRGETPILARPRGRPTSVDSGDSRDYVAPVNSR